MPRDMDPAIASPGSLLPPRFLLSAAHKSSGKTTLSIGLCAALGAGGRRVASFKKGPDYIDALWLARASGRPCYNLDPYLMEAGRIRELFAAKSAGADVAIVEGNKGLFDGVALDGSNSSAALAHVLALPVVLVIDARGMTRGIAPLLLGYQAFDRQLRIGGVILNRVGGARHEAKLRAVVERYTDIPVLGAVQEDEDIGMVERHLGLMPANEAREAQRIVERIARAVSAQVDTGRLLEIAAGARALPAPRTAPAGAGVALRVRIGVAMDRAFGFYYADDLEALEAAGARLVPFDTLRDATLPEIDALFIGGGFPETCAAELEANGALRRRLQSAIAGGLPTYAECGGLMYLARELVVDGRRHAMVGAIDAAVHMHRRPVGRGYVELQATGEGPFAVLAPGAQRVRAHEFHYSSLEGLAPGTRFAYRVTRGHGIDGRHDGIVQGNLLASYTHLRTLAGSDWTRGFVRLTAACAGSRRAQEACGGCLSHC